MEELVESSPTLSVGGEGGEVLSIERRLRHDLSPVEASQVAGVFGGDEAIGGEDIGPAVVVDIAEGGAPAPAGHVGMSGEADVGKSSFAVGLEEGVATGHALEGRARSDISAGLELLLIGDAIPGTGEHIADVDIHPSVAVKVSPVGGHAAC